MQTEQIWEEFSSRLLAFIRSKVSDDELARDMMQEVFIKIHKHGDQLTDSTKLSSWLYQITRNSITDHYRKQKPQQVELTDTVEDWVEENLNERFYSCLEPFVERLDPIYRNALQQTAYGTASQKAYAQANDLSYSAAKSRIQRARQQLKKLFMDCCAYQSDAYGNIVGARDCGSC